MAGTGFETLAHSTGKTVIPHRGGAESGAPGVSEAPIDHQLAVVVGAWPKLPAQIRAQIVSMASKAAAKRR
jgi:hypothetical protein